MMEDIYSNLDNYNEEETIEELRNENKELRFQLEDLNVRLGNLQKDFDKLCSEHKRLESNYSSLLKTAKAEVERKTQAIAVLNAEKDKLVLQALQNVNKRNIPKYNEPINKNKNNKRKNANYHADEQSMETERKDTRISPNIEPYRKDLRLSPKEDMVRPVINNSTKENISQKRPNIDDNPRSRINNRRKSMPVYDTRKFSSDEEGITNAEEYYIPKEYPDRYIDRHCRPSMRTSDCSSLEERNSYEQTKDPKSRHHRYGDREKSKNYTRSDSNRHKRDSPARYRRRNRDAYEEKRSEYDRYRRLESPPIDKYGQYSLKQHPNYEKLHYSDRRSSRSNERHATKHKAPEYEEPRSKKMKPNTYKQQYEEEKWNHEKHPIVDEYDKQFTSCQSPDINFIESSPNNHPIREIKLFATTKLDDPRKFSDRYVKDSRGKDTLLAVRGINFDIPRIPLENTCYEIECVKMPEALKEKPTTDDLLSQIYDIDDNPLVNVSIESGEIQFGPEEENAPHEDKGLIPSSKNATQKDNILNNPQKIRTSYRIPKIKSSVINTQDRKNKDVNIDLTVKRKDSDNITEVKSKNSKSKRKPSLNEDLKKDNVPELKETPLVVNEPQVPTLNKEIEKPLQLPTFSVDIETKDEHEKKKQSKKIVEDDLLLSDETCDYSEIHKTKETSPTDKKTDSKTTSLNVVQSNEVSSEVDTSKDKSPHDTKIKTKRRHSKHKSTQEHTKPVKQMEKSVKKVKDVHEVKNTEVIKHKFSELFGDSNSLILPEDLGLPAVPVQSQLAELPIFEDAQDAVDMNSKLEAVKELPKLNEISKLPVEIAVDTKVVILPKLNEIETNVEKDETKALKTNTQTDIINKETKTIDKVPIQSLYQNLEAGVKPKEDSVKTIIISSGVQPNVALNEHKSIVKEHKPMNIDLKALATSTPHKLDTIIASPILDVNPKVTDTNGHTIHRAEVDNANTTDTSLSNVDVQSNIDVPDVRIVLKRRRRVMKKP